MTTTIGKLNVKVSASSAGVKETLDATADSTARFRKRVDESAVAMNQASAGSSKFGRAFLELSRGVEDAAAVYGTAGLAGAVRASSNNISQFASIINPAAGAVAGLAVSLGSVLIPKLFDTSSAAKEVQEALTKLSRVKFDIDLGQSARAQMRGGQRDLRELGTSEDNAKFAKQQQDRTDEIKAQLDEQAKAYEDLYSRIEKPNKRIVKIQDSVFSKVREVEVTDDLTKAQLEKNKAINDELDAVAKRTAKLKSDLEVSRKLTEDAKSRERMLKNQELLVAENEHEIAAEIARQQKAADDLDKQRKRFEDDAKTAAELRRDLLRETDPRAAQLEDSAKLFRERQQQILDSTTLSVDERKVLHGQNRQALEASIRSQLESAMPSASASPALLRGSAGALNAGIDAGLRKQREKEIAENTSAMVKKIAEGNSILKDLTKGGVVVKVGSF